MASQKVAVGAPAPAAELELERAKVVVAQVCSRGQLSTFPIRRFRVSTVVRLPSLQQLPNNLCPLRY